MKYKRFIMPVSAVAMIIAGSFNSLMADEPVRKVNLAEAQQIAIENNGEYRIAQANVRAADERVNVVWGQLLPVMESEASATRQGADSGLMSLSDGQYDIRLLQLKFAINPGGFNNSLKQSHAALCSAREELRRVRGNIEYSVIKSYYNVILTAEIVKLKKDSLKVLEENLRDVENLYRSGSVPRFELLQARVFLQNIEAEIIDSETVASVALDTFNLVLGSSGRLYDARGDEISGEGFNTPADEKVLPDLEAMALKNRPEVISLQYLRQGQEHGISVQKSAYLWPIFSVAGSYGFSYNLANPPVISIPGAGSMEMSSVTGNREWQDTWQIRAAATYRWSSLIPFDSGRAMEREEKETLEGIDEKIKDLKRATVIAVRGHYGKIHSSSRSIVSQRNNIETATEGLRIARESYRAGVIRNTELLSAELSLTTARTGYIRALYDYSISMAALRRDAGADVDSILFREK